MGKPWLKLWTETLHDAKLRRVEPAIRWCWCGILMLAAERENHGRLEIADNVPYSDVDFVDALGVSSETWAEAAGYFVKLGMLQADGDTLVVAKYDARQASSDPTGARRQAEWRAKHLGVTNALRNDVTAPLLSRVESEVEVDNVVPKKIGTPLVKRTNGKEPTEHQLWFGTVCEAIGSDPHTLSERQCKEVSDCIAALRKANYTRDDLITWRRDVWPATFPGNKGDCPTVSQIRAGIGKLRAKPSDVKPFAAGVF